MDSLANDPWLLRLLDHPNFLPFGGLVLGAIAIVATATITIVVTKLALAHRQRMAMIARGLHPDALIGEMDEAPAPPTIPQRPAS